MISRIIIFVVLLGTYLTTRDLGQVGALLALGVIYNTFCLLRQRSFVQGQIERAKLHHAEALARGNYEDTQKYRNEIEELFNILAALNGFDDIRRIEDKVRAQR